MTELGGLEIELFASQSAWGEWLDIHHEQPEGIWLKIAKKGSSVRTVTYAEALEEALCYGWIDGQKKSYDDHFFLQKFTARRPKSVWSQVNVDKVANLIAAGRMKPHGMHEVNVAKEDGRWEAAYDSQRNFSIPDDFSAQLERNERAKVFFETLNRHNRYAMCHRIQTAIKPETRQARIEKFIEMLNNHQKLYP